jgi:hypothetical protein
LRLQLHATAYNLANFLRTLALPGDAQWALTSLREKVVKIGAKVVSHGRYAIFQVAEVTVPRELFRHILDRIARLRPPDLEPCRRATDAVENAVTSRGRRCHRRPPHLASVPLGEERHRTHFRDDASMVRRPYT